MSKIFIKAWNIFFVLLFLLSAGLQYNDPDPYLWMPLYLYSVGLCYAALKNNYYPKAYFAGIVVYFGYSCFLFLGSNGVLSWLFDYNAENIVQSMHADKPYIENTREFFGLCLMLLALSVNWIYFRTKTSLM